MFQFFVDRGGHILSTTEGATTPLSRPVSTNLRVTPCCGTTLGTVCDSLSEYDETLLDERERVNGSKINHTQYKTVAIESKPVILKSEPIEYKYCVIHISDWLE